MAVVSVDHGENPRHHEERSFDRPRLVISGVQLILLIVSTCALLSMMLGALFVALIFQLGAFGH